MGTHSGDYVAGERCYAASMDTTWLVLTLIATFVLLACGHVVDGRQAGRS